MEETQETQGTQNDEKLELEKLRAENAKLKAPKNLRLQVSQKGALSIYGLGRFPVTLYRDAILQILDMEVEIREFIEEHSEELPTKADINK